MNLKAKILGFSALGVFLALPAAADVVNVYQIGATSNICGPHTAQDPSGACINGSAAPTWVNIFSGNLGDQATLTILRRELTTAPLRATRPSSIGCL